MFAEQVVEHPKELQHPLLPPRVRQAGVVDHEVRVDLAVVAADVEAARSRVVLLHDLDARHEALDVHLWEGEGRRSIGETFYDDPFTPFNTFLAAGLFDQFIRFVLVIQSNPLNGSPDNGSILLIVLYLAGPILYCFLSKSLLDNGSIFAGQKRGTIKRICLYFTEHTW